MKNFNMKDSLRKLNILKFFGIALVAVIGFGFASCGPGAGEVTGSYLINGTFKSQTTTGDAVFYADYVSNGRSVGINSVSGAGRSVARAVGGMAAAEKELSGKIEDGDIVFNLKGVYNTDTGAFFLSAGSSVLIYQVAGTVSSTGAMSGASAAVKVKTSETEWVTHEVEVFAAETTEIAKAADASQEDGLPSSWYGLWESDEGFQCILTAYQLIDTKFPDLPAGLLDTVALPGGKYETVWQMISTSTTGSSDPNEEPVITKSIDYGKIIMEEADGSNLKLTIYTDSGRDNYAEAKAYPIKEDSPVNLMIFHRP